MRERFVVLLIAVLASFGTGIWGLAYATSSSTPTQAPFPGSYISSSQPEVVAEMPEVTGLSLKRAAITVDGIEAIGDIRLDGRQVSFIPSDPLGDGFHTVDVVLDYSVLLIPRSIQFSWGFFVDTVAPDIVPIDQGMVATFESDQVFTVRAEPGVQVRAVMAGNDLSVTETVDGLYQVNLTGVESEHALTVSAADLAGNTSEQAVTVVRDMAAPVIEMVYPTSADVVRDTGVTVVAQFIEGESFIRNGIVSIDGTKHQAAISGDTVVVRGLSGLKDGEHTCRVEVEDAAGNIGIKEIAFQTDSRKIVISRAERRLYLYQDGAVLKTYGVAVGTARYPTPRGDFEITAMRYRPTWRNPGSGWGVNMPDSIGPGPGNPLGTRAMNINANAIRIHGTYASGSIGSAASHGCIRMRISESEELFELVGVGTPVIIQ